MLFRNRAPRDAAWERRIETFDNIVCVGVFLVASTPAIVVMLIMAWPLLPFFGACFLAAASGRGGTSDENRLADAEVAIEKTPHASHPHGPTPRYA